MKLRLILAKNRLRSAYIAYQNEADRMSCGAALSNHITGGRLDALRKLVNSELEAVKKLDPTCTVKPLSA